MLTKERETSRQEDLKVLSAMPGRMRLRFAKGNGNGGHSNLRNLVEIRGVERITFNQLTGSLLIQYRQDDISCERLLSSVCETLAFPLPKAASESMAIAPLTCIGIEGNKEFEILHHSEGRLRLKSDMLLDSGEKMPETLQSIFYYDGVRSVRVNPLLGTVLINYDPARIRGENILLSIAEKRRNGTIFSASLAAVEPQVESLVFTQVGKMVTNFQIVSDLPGRLRLRHPVLYERSAYCHRLKLDLEEAAGIDEVKVCPYTASILVKYDKDFQDPNKIIHTCEEIMTAMPSEFNVKDEKGVDPFFISSISFGISFIAVPWLSPVSFGIIAWTAIPIVEKAVKNLRKKKITVDVLDSIVIMAALGLWQLPIAAFMVWILDVADMLLKATTKQSQAILGTVFSGKASYAWMLVDGEEVKVPLKKIQEGDIVVISTGERIPVDGVIDDGEGSVDQQIITGEAAPVEKMIGDKVFTSTVLLAGKLYVKAENVGDNTIEAKIAKIIGETANFEPKVLTKGLEFANRMVIPTLALGFVGLTVGGPGVALAILNADFGTGIRVAAPTALLSYLAVAAKNGIVIKNGKCLENLLKVDTVLFDKTGTLTKEIPKVAKVACNEGFDEKDVLAFAATAEERFGHPLARAIVEKAQELKLPRAKMDETKYHLGFGIFAVINDRNVKIGSMRFMEKEGIEILQEIKEQVHESMNRGGCGVMVSFDDVLAGAIILESSERLEAYDVVQALKKRKKKVILISGDHEAPTKILCQRLGIDEYYYEKLPHEKADFVRALQSQGKKVAMVGDGVNDSIALSLADTSVSLRGASDIAMDVADVVFMDGSLVKLEALYQVAEGLDKTIKKCFKMILVPNSLCIFGALMGIVQLGMSLILNNFANIAASINATLPLRHLHQTPETGKEGK